MLNKVKRLQYILPIDFGIILGLLLYQIEISHIKQQ